VTERAPRYQRKQSHPPASSTPEDELKNVLISLLATMDKNNAMKLSAFVLLIVGTIGLLVNEFVASWGRGVTIAFACLNVLGLAVLAYATWAMGKR
jgi:hypothetical protein